MDRTVPCSRSALARRWASRLRIRDAQIKRKNPRMSPTLLALLAFLPIVLAGVLLIGFRMPARAAA